LQQRITTEESPKTDQEDKKRQILDIKYTSYKTPDRIAKACKTAISKRLFVPGWTMRDFLIYDQEFISHAVIARHEGKPIAVGLLVREVPYCFRGSAHTCWKEVAWLQLFVRKKYRRKGIGTEIFRRLKRSCKKKEIIHAGRHDEKSCSFFDSLGYIKQHPDYELEYEY
jgi:GNAT superfamily N-acetyltransferase